MTAAELLEIRDQFPYGKYPLRIETQTFRPAEYRKFLGSIQREAAAFKKTQEAAFLAERERWAAAGAVIPEEPAPEPVAAEERVPEGHVAVQSPVAANVWKLVASAGQRVEAGDQLMILEAMKMEIVVTAPESGVVTSMRCSAGQMVLPGQHVATLKGVGA